VVKAAHDTYTGGSHAHPNLQSLCILLSHGCARCSLNLTHHFFL
jgi:hypothetical protein